MGFAVIVTSDEARSGFAGNPLVTAKGERFVVTVAEVGWVEASSKHYISGNLPADTKIFRTRASAEKFARRWKGHPWCVSNGEYYEVREVRRLTRSTRETIGFCST